MADADGATRFSDIDKVEAGLKDIEPNPVSLYPVVVVIVVVVLHRYLNIWQLMCNHPFNLYI